MDAAHAALGGTPEFALILLGEASAYPHGSGQPQAVRDGEVVLMDCGCTVEGYQSDISRTFVFGEATAEQRRVWEQMRDGQQIAIETARVGVPAGSVDDAVRAQYVKWGYGPGYKLPGLSHRTGHGIGLDGHEPVNLVHGETTPLAPGMCFSNEPGIYLPGKFGIRLEDCFHMGAEKPDLVLDAAAVARQSVRLNRTTPLRRRLRVGALALKNVLGAAVRALRPAGLLDRQIDPRVRVPEIHLRHRARERQIAGVHFVFVLRVGLDERFGGWHGRRIIEASPLSSSPIVAFQMALTAARSSANSSAGTTASACSSDRWWARSRYFL